MRMTSLVAFLYGLVLPWSIYGSCPINPQDCQQCTLVTQVSGYLADPCNTCDYYQCQMLGGGVWQADLRPCAPCTCWDETELTCGIRIPNCSVNQTATYAPIVINPCLSSPCQHGGTCKTYNSGSGLGYYCVCQYNYYGMNCEYGSGVVMPTEATCITFDLGYDNFTASRGIWISHTNVVIVPGVGVYGNAGYFPGNAQIEVPFFINNYNYPAFSISFWVMRTDSGSGCEGLFTNGDCTQNPTLQIRSDSSSTIGGGFVTTNNALLTAFTGRTVPYGVWTHVVVSYNSTYINVYINGVLSSPPVACTGNIVNDQCPLLIGYLFSGSTPFFFKGYMDDICIFKTSLNDDQVKYMKLHPNFFNY